MVVGASSGIGQALAEKFAKTHKISALARREERLADLKGEHIHFEKCDVTDLQSIESIVSHCVAINGKIDAMIFCAGQQMIKPMRIISAADIESMIKVNLSAAIIFARLFASPKFSQSDSVFCAISSIAAQRPEPAIVPYSVAKAGIDALIKGLARECGPRRAVAIAPGWLDTEMTQSFGRVYNDTFQEELAKKAPCGIANIQSIVDSAEFLLSKKAAHITGQILTVDGGAVL